MSLVEAKEKGRLLNEALKIIVKLANNELADVDGDCCELDEDSIESVKRLIVEARTLITDRWWESLR